MTQPIYWCGDLGETDDFGDRYSDTMIDGRTLRGTWANMTPDSWYRFGCGKFGQGYGQRYKKQADGRWLKVEG